MSPHSIIYLDQNYTSNLAKARTGSIEDKDQAEFWNSLFYDLYVAVVVNKISCPESEFHLSEAKYDRRLLESIKRTIKILSGGLQLSPWNSILESQIQDAARQFLGKQPEQREDWAIAFMSDPHSKYKDRIKDIISGRIINYVHPLLKYADIYHDRQLKSGFVEKAKRTLAEYNKKTIGWDELVLDNKKGVINGFIEKLAEESLLEKMRGNYPLEDKIIALIKHKRLENLLNSIHLIGINPKDPDIMNRFVRSKELLDSPYIEINASIQAAITEQYLQGRKIRESDLYDVPILSSVLPYCDVVTTDSFMKEILVKRLHFDTKYDVKIFSASQKDRLAFRELIKELSRDP